MSALAIEHFAQDVGLTQRHQVPEGLSVYQIARRFHEHLDGLTAWVRAPEGCLEEWLEIPRSMWGFMRPKIDGVLKFGYRLSNDSFKKIFAIVATVVVAVVAPYIAPALVPIFGSFAFAAATAALTVGASLLQQALFPAGSGSSAQIGSGVKDGKNESRAFSNLEADSNLIAKEAYLPVIVGQRRVSLPEIAQARPFLDPASGLQSLHRIFALDGQHSISDIQLDGVPIAGDNNFKVEVIEGAEDDPTSTFIDKVSWTDDISAELSNFSLSEKVLVDQDTPANSAPRWERFKTRYDERLEAITIRLALSNMYYQSAAGTKVRLPIRIRFRPLGSTEEWTNIPEIHFIGNLASVSLQEIVIRWDNYFGIADQAGDIAHQFFKEVPAADAGPLSSGALGRQWIANHQFLGGAQLRDVINMSGGRNGIRVKLDPTISPIGAYEFEILRGYSVTESSLNVNTYAFSGSVHSFFEGYSTNGAWSIKVDQGAYPANAQLVFVSILSDRKPCQRPGTALLAIESKGQSVKNVTALCGSMVPDWNGEEWGQPVLTKNPASHFRSVLSKHYDHHGTSNDLIDVTSIEAFHDECKVQGYEVSGVFAGPTTASTLASIAEAGFALPAMRFGMGVDWFRDRSSERPVQTFSPRNATIKLEYHTGQKPSGIRAKFQNERKAYADDEIEVNNPFYTSFGGYEVQEYPTITNPDLVRRRAFFDMLQIHEQARRAWIVDAAIEGLMCAKGDMVGVVTDLLDDQSFGARVRDVISYNTFRIDQAIPAQSTESVYDVANIFEQNSVLNIGEQSVIFLSTPTGAHQSSIIAVEDDLIRIADNLDTLDFGGAHVTIGPVSNFMNRCIVRSVTPLDEERSQLVLVDEAPATFEQLKAKFG